MDSYAITPDTATVTVSPTAPSYLRKSYGSVSVGMSDRLAIVVVNFQYGFTDPEAPLGGSPHVASAVQKTAQLLRVAREYGLPVCTPYTAYANSHAMPHWKVLAFRTELMRETRATQLDERIADPTDFSFEKWGASAFFQSPLSSYLATQRVDTVAICGCTTSGCVRATVVDAFQYGFQTLLVTDGCGDQDLQPHADTLRDVGLRYADLISVDDLIEIIRQREGGEAPIL